MYVIAGVGALAAMATATTAPAGIDAVNMLLRGAFTAGVSIAASRARRWTWLVLCGVAAVVVEGPWLVVAGAGMLMAFASVLLSRRRFYGAASGALGALALFHTEEGQLGGAAVFICIGVSIPVFVSAYQVSPRGVRRKIHRTALAIGAVAMVAAVMWGVAAGLAYPRATGGAELARNGLEQIRDGNTETAAATLAESATELRSANTLLSGLWTKPALAIPGLSQQVIALDVSTKQATALAEQGSITASKVDYESLRYENGRTDLQRIREVQEPLRKSAEIMAEAERALTEVQTDALVGPVSTQIDELLSEVRQARSEADTAMIATEVAPGMLGADGERRYFVLFTTPAELRGLGGFMGNWAILHARDGKLELGESGRARELNDRADNAVANGADLSITAPEDFVLRYQRWHVEEHLQDITVPPDLPMISEVLGSLHPRIDGTKIDGTIVVDPYGLAGLIEMLGPITVPGYPEPLDENNVADVLLNRQYTEFEDTEAREEFLEEALRQPFERLSEVSLPSPREIGKVLGPRVAERRLMFWTFHPEEQAFLDRLGVSGRYGGTPDHDFLGITTQNSANNKIDIHFERSIEYRVAVDPATGLTEAKARVTLTNNAPSAGAPMAVIGNNDQGLPIGTNYLYFSLYSKLGLRRAMVDGTDRPVEFQRELGLNVYSARITIPSMSTVVLDFDLSGQLPAGRSYSLDYIPQPTVNPDLLNVQVVPEPNWMVRSTEGGLTGALFVGEIDGSKASLYGEPRQRLTLKTEVQPR